MTTLSPDTILPGSTLDYAEQWIAARALPLHTDDCRGWIQRWGWKPGDKLSDRYSMRTEDCNCSADIDRADAMETAAARLVAAVLTEHGATPDSLTALGVSL